MQIWGTLGIGIDLQRLAKEAQKEERVGVMISGFADEERGLGLTLTDDQINQVSTNRVQKGKGRILLEPYYSGGCILYPIG